MPNEEPTAPRPRARLTEADVHVALAALGLLPYLAWARPDLMPPREDLTSPERLYALPGMAVVA
ncbi:hypothetical protein J421_1878 [Gemmatirosa kalamazoonensis]|uniref:Uncharacterized protein n=1 Tax=Gemmatirosa kalamazoonensis TaxID=861299 RepID=W0RGF5_9BACT|nr:hypothetical protein [Gemmatirosa kalamazoonensis]AHG89415.1 hypothetical protein J421_1878 [Gemmatirosa kalamazoonensis]